MTIVLLLIGLAQLFVQVVMLMLVVDEAPVSRIDEVRDLERGTIDRMYQAAADSQLQR